MGTNGGLIWPSAEEVEEKIELEGVKFTVAFWKSLQVHKNLVLTPKQAEIYKIVQKAHIKLTGYSLPDTIKGAIKTRAQIRNDLGTLDEDKIEVAVQSGLAARLAQMRKEKQND